MTTRARHRASEAPVLSICIAAILASACAPTDSTPAAASTPAASAAAAPAGARGYDCADLLTEQEIDRVVGASGTRNTLAMREDEMVPGHSACSYELPDGAMVNVDVFTGESIENLERWEENLQGRAISGLGDHAFLSAAPGTGFPILLVRVRDRGFRVMAGDLNGRSTLDLQDVTRRIAAIVVQRV